LRSLARSKGSAAVAAALLYGAALGALAICAQAHAARVLLVHDEGRLRFVSGAGSTVVNEGSVSGTLPGKVRLHYKYSGGPALNTLFTVYGRGWTVRVDALVRLSDPTSPNPSFRGTLRITGGTGRFVHCTGRGELFGVFSRRTYGLTVQALGKLTY
jgi:hypothetical protein